MIEVVQSRTPRNFWVDVECGGRKNPLRGGTQSLEDGIDIRIYMRDRGEIFDGLHIKGEVFRLEGNPRAFLNLSVIDPATGEVLHEVCAPRDYEHPRRESHD